MMHIGKRIRELLLEKQMSITLFAEQLGCTRENAHRILVFTENLVFHSANFVIFLESYPQRPIFAQKEADET